MLHFVMVAYVLVTKNNSEKNVSRVSFLFGSIFIVVYASVVKIHNPLSTFSFR